ncbi:hypothetical protein PISS_a1052 [Pseudoalteromonas issachenkonii]|uniref:Uncharacterized protein n=1 Tax=Pseudoalteromonas issachenkonii TaxID=152297 RepID=A0ABM6N1L0_9GAMM|nr:hypothetical protein PISS_a1052 [Pseudoalteromonas issachenkonii]
MINEKVAIRLWLFYMRITLLFMGFKRFAPSLIHSVFT